MTGYSYLLLALCAMVGAAPPAPPRLYQHQVPAHLQTISPLDYFMDNSDVSNYYNQAQQKQGANGAPSRLETLEPDSEVELIPGAQQPQQPPQQNPVAPNIPGLLPGQRVFIVHMPVPGYRPGTIGGYQPVYIVAAAPQGNPGYATNGYQNTVLLNPSGQVVTPFFGYPGAGVAQPQSGLIVGAPLQFTRPFDQGYQEQFAYQPGPAPQAVGTRGALNLSQLVSLQGQLQAANSPRNTGDEPAPNPEPKRVGDAQSEEQKETQEARRNARPSPPHAQARTKA